MRLSKKAFQTNRLLPNDVNTSYGTTVSALKARFKAVDIEELRGMEFNQVIQKAQSVQRLGLELQKLAKRAFPCLSGKDFNRQMKGHFFQELLPKCQRSWESPR